MIYKMTPENEELGQAVLEAEESTGRAGFLRAGLLLVTSAALGGIAMAIWNRRTLARIRQQTSSEIEADEPVND
jgi:hypothetical protein